MFDLDASKIVIVGVAALIFIPPKDLPRVLRQAGQFVGKMKRMAAEFQGQFMDAMREADMADLRQEAQKLSDAARVDVGLKSVHDLEREMRPLAPKPAADNVHRQAPTQPETAMSPGTSAPPDIPAAPKPIEPAIAQSAPELASRAAPEPQPTS